MRDILPESSEKFSMPSDSIRIKEFETFLRRLNELPEGIKTQMFPLEHGTKEPQVLGSWKTISITHDFAREVVSRGDNIACVAHANGLFFIDFDLDTRGNFAIPEEEVERLIAEYQSFTVKTKSGGYQIYFISDGIKEFFAKNGRTNAYKFKYKPDSKFDGGEVRFENAYVTAPGSWVSPIERPKKGKEPKGWRPGADGLYRVHCDLPIKKLKPEQLPKWMIDQVETLGYEFKKSGGAVKFDPNKYRIIKREAVDEFINDDGVPLTMILDADHDLQEMLLTSSLSRGVADRSRDDFKIAGFLKGHNFSNNTIAEIFQFFRRHEKVVNRRPEEYLIPTIEKAPIMHRPSVAIVRNIDKQIFSTKRVSATTLPGKLPKAKYVLILAPPRFGKTHWAIRQLVSHRSGVYCTSRHEIIKQALYHNYAYTESGRTAVWLKGKSRCCNNDSNPLDCQFCIKRPRAHLGKDESGILDKELKVEAKRILETEHILTEELLKEKYPDFCPYYTLLLAESFSDFCFCTPQFLTMDSSDGIHGVKNVREVLIMDEDQVFDSFYPPCVQVAEYMDARGRSYANTIDKLSIKTAQKIIEKINEKKRTPTIDKYIRGILHAFLDINDIINKHGESVDGYTPSRLEADLVELFSDVRGKMPIPGGMIAEIRSKLTEYDNEYGVGGDILNYISPILYQSEIPFSWQSSKPRKLYMIASRHIEFKPTDYKHVVCIGATNAELYLRDIVGYDTEGESSIAYQIETFPYKDNFVFVVFTGKLNEQKMMFDRSINAHAGHNRRNIQIAKSKQTDDSVIAPTVPALILEASKAKMDNRVRGIGEGAVACSRDGIDSLIQYWMGGKMCVIPANGIASRGIDVPIFDIMYIGSSSFATPYWTAIKRNATDHKKQEVVSECTEIIDKLISDEITNCIFRIAPVRNSKSLKDKNAEEYPQDAIKMVYVKENDRRFFNPRYTSGIRNLEIDLNRYKISGGALFSDWANKAPTTLFSFGQILNQLFAAQNGLRLPPILCDNILNTFENGYNSLKGKKANELESELKSKLEHFSDAYSTKEEAQITDIPLEILDSLRQNPRLSGGKDISEHSLIKFIYERRKGKIYKISENTIKKYLDKLVKYNWLRKTNRAPLKQGRKPRMTIDHKGNLMGDNRPAKRYDFYQINSKILDEMNPIEKE